MFKLVMLLLHLHELRSLNKNLLEYIKYLKITLSINTANLVVK